MERLEIQPLQGSPLGIDILVPLDIGPAPTSDDIFIMRPIYQSQELGNVYSVAWICTLSTEFVAVQAFFDKVRRY